ncbi:NUDIX hydrolase [Sporosarcina sp. ANT_H38]|uniref:NUDIX hydrolase n=1 Tax=Sporosarcina sp. ANT_H38 TaxID=2597358 RepID=UPI0011F209A8|nr:NUDIX hydrolase [Sporosarcina sp. ANT_H38]KAA0964953.1 NUDIX hydrolase [Sporosarcina sp. ANT_H38]
MGYIQELRDLVGNRPIVMTGANVILLDNEKRLLLQLRTDNNCWGLAGGSLEPGETLEEVAKRELYEETNLVAKQLSLFKVFSGQEFYYKYPHGDEVYNVIATYICTDYEGVMKEQADEVQALKFFRFDELPGKLNPPEIPILSEFITTHYCESI